MTNTVSKGGGSAAGADNSSMHSSMLGSRVAGQPGTGGSVAVKSEALPQAAAASSGQLSVKSGDTTGQPGSIRDKVPS
jgi:hypothetical protein